MSPLPMVNGTRRIKRLTCTTLIGNTIDHEVTVAPAIEALAKKVIESPSQISLPKAVEVTVKVGTGVINMLIASETSLQTCWG